jgi:hypothetical protein
MAAHRAANDTANNLRNYTKPRDSYQTLYSSLGFAKIQLFCGGLRVADVLGTTGEAT